MSSGFSINELLYPIITNVHKGDTPGHPFHGNQYAQGASGTAANERSISLARTTKELWDNANAQHNSKDFDPKAWSNGHGSISRFHQKLRDEYNSMKAQAEKEGRGSDAKRFGKVADAHQKAADAHQEASDTWRRVAGKEVPSQDGENASQDAHYATLKAADLVR